MNTVPTLAHRGDVYALALELERIAWDALHGPKRTDPRYAEALAEWRTAADGIGIAAEHLKKPPSAWSGGLHRPQQTRTLQADARR